MWLKLVLIAYSLVAEATKRGLLMDHQWLIKAIGTGSRSHLVARNIGHLGLIKAITLGESKLYARFSLAMITIELEAELSGDGTIPAL